MDHIISIREFKKVMLRNNIMEAIIEYLKDSPFLKSDIETLKEKINFNDFERYRLIDTCEYMNQKVLDREIYKFFNFYLEEINKEIDRFSKENESLDDLKSFINRKICKLSNYLRIYCYQAINNME